MYILKNREKTLRLGITTSKKTGNAVKRNRSRRILKEAIKELELNIVTGYDIVLVARGKTPFLKTGDLTKALVPMLKSAGIYRDARKNTDLSRTEKNKAQSKKTDILLKSGGMK